MRGIAAIYIVLLFLLLAGAGATAYMLGSKNDKSVAESASAPSPKPSATPTAKDPKVTYTKNQIKIELDEDTLTKVANQTLSGASLGNTPFGEAKVASIKIDFQPGIIKISGDASAGAITLPIEADAKVNLIDSKPKVSITNAKVGVIPLPSVITSQMEAPIQLQIDNLLTGKNIKIGSVEITDTKLIIIGTQK